VEHNFDMHVLHIKISKHAQDGSANFITTHKSKAYVNKISEICFNTDVGEGLQMKQDWQ
jgi:hypothetical protein